MAIYASDPGSLFYKRPITRGWFQTPPDPNPPAVDPFKFGSQSSGCFAPYTPTVDGTKQPANYSACKQARDACNAAPNTTWEQARNRCIASGG